MIYSYVIPQEYNKMQNPYQSSSQSIREGNELPLNLIKNAGLTALGGAAATAGAKAMSKIVPAVGAMISKYVPDNIMTEGLSKINPNLGTFMKSALDSGYTHDDIREFLGDKIQKSQEQTTATDNRNLIEKHSPELHQFITQQIKKGRGHKEAGALARIGTGGKSFDKVIDKITKENKTTWDDILEAVYGGAKSDNNAAPAAQNPSNMTGNAQPQQAPQQGQQPQAQQAVSPNQQALINALSRIPKRTAK